jgi:putative isomerase
MSWSETARWTDWWFTYRNPDGDGLPQYHHGNDSGWDNGTAFDAGFPVKGADLAAFLVLQMDVLAEVAGRLGKPAEAETWQRRADQLLGALLSRLWRGDRFVSPRAGDGAIAERSDSVFNCLPLVLGQRLPLPVRRQLVMNLQRYLTPYGPATEHIHSLLYEDDGYWRGPIWAPSTLLLVDGLRACGETALAAGVARRFCDLAKQSGFAENYNARTGEPLRDHAYTWTSSVFLILAHEYLADEYIRETQ